MLEEGWVVILMKIRFCKHNKGAGKAFERVKKEFPAADVKIKDCLKKCGQCHKSPFVLVDGKPVCAIDIEELLNKIRSLT